MGDPQTCFTACEVSPNTAAGGESEAQTWILAGVLALNTMST